MTPRKSLLRNVAAMLQIASIGLVLSPNVIAGYLDERAKPAAALIESSSPAKTQNVARDSAPAQTSPVKDLSKPEEDGDYQVLVGEFGEMWDRPLEGSGMQVPLRAAIKVMNPSTQLSLAFEPNDGKGEELTMNWKQGAIPRQVLTEFARANALKLKLQNGQLTATRSLKQLSSSELAAIKPDQDGTNPAKPAIQVESSSLASPTASVDDKKIEPQLKKFEVRLGDVRLHVAMQRWATDSGMRLRWDAERHLLISAPTVFEAHDALEAIGMALSTPGIVRSEYPLEVCIYPNVPPLLRITRQGEQTKDCPN